MTCLVDYFAKNFARAKFLGTFQGGCNFFRKNEPLKIQFEWKQRFTEKWWGYPRNSKFNEFKIQGIQNSSENRSPKNVRKFVRSANQIAANCTNLCIRDESWSDLIRFLRINVLLTLFWKRKKSSIRTKLIYFVHTIKVRKYFAPLPDRKKVVY